MKATDTTTALLRLCRENPEFQKRMAQEIGTKKRAAVDRDYMVWQSLQKVMDLAPQVLELVRADLDGLEDWQEYKINLAAEYLDAVYDSLKYKPEDIEIDGVEMVVTDAVPTGE